MTKFKITPTLTAVCKSERTRYGFRHIATLYRHDKNLQIGNIINSETAQAVLTTSVSYYNRTWERYTFETVLYKLHESLVINPDARELVRSRITLGESVALYHMIKSGTQGLEKDMAPLRSVSFLAELADVLVTEKSARNDWKVRMLKAGFGDEIIMPGDWHLLTEEEKEGRLNSAIKEISQ